MKKKYFTRILTGSLLALLCTLPAAAANLAGTAVFVSGKPTATDPAGGIRELKARDEVYSGDLLETTKGRVQIKFVDGAFMSIQPNSRFQIENYNYANGSDGSEKAVYNLFKGGMRAFTGAIGKKHTDAYKVKTPVATIGIRGTGHNTRICSGDCTSAAGLPLPDGLYHSTWEGTTYVENDFGTSTVPFGNSVYVQSIDSPAEETSEASQVTAVQPSQDTVEELVNETQEQETLTIGDELDGNDDDCPVGITCDGSGSGFGLTMVPNQTLIGIEPALDPATEDGNAGSGIIFNSTVLVGSDSASTNGMVGTVGTEEDKDDSGVVLETRDLLITIDPNGILAIGPSTDPNVTRAQGLINEALGGDDAAAVNLVIEKPALIQEYTPGNDGTYFSNYAYGRWADGNVLFIDKSIDPGSLASVKARLLTGGRNVHWMYGDMYGDTEVAGAVGATGTYNLLGGTNSSNTNGGEVVPGSGVQSGRLAFNFTTMDGSIIDMKILHDTTYTVNGALKIDGGNFFNVTNGVNTVGGTCDPVCDTLIDGSFFGPNTDADDVVVPPVLAGLDYEIVTMPFNGDTGNSIIGNAIFERDGPIPTDTQD